MTRREKRKIIIILSPPKLGCMLGNTGGFWAGEELRTGPNMFLKKMIRQGK